MLNTTHGYSEISSALELLEENLFPEKYLCMSSTANFTGPEFFFQQKIPNFRQKNLFEEVLLFHSKSTANIPSFPIF